MSLQSLILYTSPPPSLPHDTVPGVIRVVEKNLIITLILVTCYEAEEVQHPLPSGQPQVAEDTVRIAQLGVAALCGYYRYCR